VPRHARVLQSWIDVSLNPLLQVADIRACDGVRELAHIPLQCSIHQAEAANQKLQMVIWGVDVEPPVGAPGWIGDEVRERLVERSDGIIDILLEDEERIDR